MKTLLVLLLFFPINLFGQNLTAKDIETQVKRVDSLREKNKLQKLSYPDMSPCGGALDGYYFNEELILIDATFQAELGFSSTTIYLKDTLFVQINYREHFAKWDEYEKKYPVDKYEWDPKKMNYTDTLYTIIFSSPMKFNKKTEDKIISKKIDQELVNTLVECGTEMKIELGEVKAGR